MIFDDDPDQEYIKSVQISSSANSIFAKLGEELALIDEYGCIDTDYLDELRVLATLRKGKDGSLYIHKICIDEQYYEESEDNEEEGEEEDER